MPFGGYMTHARLARRPGRIVPVHPTMTAGGSTILGSLAGAAGQILQGGWPSLGQPPGVGFNPPPGAMPMGGGFRRSRRMNPCNHKALRRAIRRAKAFEKIALKSIRLVSPQKARHKHFGGFKKARAKR